MSARGPDEASQAAAPTAAPRSSIDPLTAAGGGQRVAHQLLEPRTSALGKIRWEQTGAGLSRLMHSAATHPATRGLRP